MDVSIFLAQFFGLYISITGLVALWNYRNLIEVIEAFEQNIILRLMVGMVLLGTGLLLVLHHNIWTNDYKIIITIVSWFVLLKGLLYLLLPQGAMSKIIRWTAHTPTLLIIRSITLLFGLYLIYIGFF
ncbi:hypothetical protein COB64_02170 [Candidatus Wolfebacteria bacterium]|nr:MAG: hypothetical protein COB64_02170 [Candidatus Wolfebacteria bacterium]